MGGAPRAWPTGRVGPHQALGLALTAVTRCRSALQGASVRWRAGPGCTCAAVYISGPVSSCGGFNLRFISGHAPRCTYRVPSLLVVVSICGSSVGDRVECDTTEEAAGLSEVRLLIKGLVHPSPFGKFH